MRPEVIAFRELDTLVRKITDQLAGYRRRALAAEGKARELEQRLDRAVEKGEAALAAARAEAVSLRRVLDDVRSQSEGQSLTDVSLSLDPPVGASATRNSTDLSAYGDIAVENERLRARLGEARERTSRLVERVRFLRQQMTHGAER